MIKFYDELIKDTFKMILEGECVNKEAEKKFVAYSEFLINMPNERTNTLVSEVLEGVIKENGVKVFDDTLKRIINKGLLEGKEDRELSLEEEELYSSIYNYYTKLISRL